MSEKRSLKETLRLLFSWKMIAMGTFGFVSGLPNYIVGDVLKIWMTQEGVSLKAIGLFTAVGIPYAWKFVWAPAVDGINPPFFGRRRGWIILSQALLIAAIIGLGLIDPQISLWWVAVAALVVAFFGATQDIVLDAFRREYLDDAELGFGTGVWMNTWRLSSFAAIGVAAFSESGISWPVIHILLAALMLMGIATAIFVPEPKVALAPAKNIQDTVVEPFKELLSRQGIVWVLAFVILYKLGDNMGSAMVVPYILKLGFTVKEYLYVVKGLGMLGLFGGVLVGGAVLARVGIAKGLWIFGVLQAVSTACYATLYFGHSSEAFDFEAYGLTLLSGLVFFELLSTGMGQAAYASFMAIQTNKKFTGTQYALLTSLMAIPVKGAAAVTGFLAEGLGWIGFYITCGLVAIPGMLLLFKVAPWNKSDEEIDVMTREKS